MDKTRLVLLPEDPDASARALRDRAARAHGVDVAVIVSDTMGRPWRNGLTDVALGVAGIDAIRDHRGEVDPYGNELQLTQMAVVDELAAAGELIKGKCDQMPVAVVRGYLTAPRPDDGVGASALVRDAAQDLFSLGTAEARAAGLAAAATLPDGPNPTPPDPEAVRRAIGTVAGVVAPGTVFSLVADEEVRAGLTARVPGWPAGRRPWCSARRRRPPAVRPGPLRRRPATPPHRPGRRGRRLCCSPRPRHPASAALAL